MRNNKNALDEMQRERRNHIGNQMFQLMFYALVLDCGLSGYGVRWLPYPVNVMVIITACMGIYLVRLIALNAYLPPKAQTRKTAVTLMMAVAFSVTLAIASIKLFGLSPAESVEPSEDHGAIILMIVSVVGLIGALIAAAIRRANDKEGKWGKDE